MKALPLLLVLATCPPLLASTPVNASEADYVRSDLYPAEVRSLTYYNQQFDNDHPLKIGYWTVRFGASFPKALFHEEPDGSNAQVEIQDLVCTDEGLGTFSCGLSLPSEGVCVLIVDIPPETFVDQLGDAPDFMNIACPVSIELTD